MTGERPGRVRLTGRGWGILAGAVVLGVAAYVAGVHELLLAACFAGLLVLAALALVILGRPGVDVRRDVVPPYPMTGMPLRVTLTLRPPSGRPAPRGLWREYVPWDEVGGELPPPDKSRTQVLRYETVPPMRGPARLGAVSLRVTDPFGLATNTRTAGTETSVTVLPFLAALDDSGFEVSAGEGVTRLRDNRVSPSDDDLSTREYRRGDPMRRVHWRASAHHGELMVRQEEQHSVPEARLVLETRREWHVPAMLPPSADRPESDAFEWCVSMLGSAAVHLTRLGYRIATFETAGERQLTDPLPDEELAPGSAFLTALATVQLTEAYDLHEIPAASSDAQGPLVAVVGSVDVALARWLRAVRGRGRVGLVFAAGPVEPQAEELLSGPGWSVRAVDPADDLGAVWVGTRELSRV
ncbi:DUF58 domain-containing protein [Herbiconiux sp. SYSU D00978]|uniref:DUF58 domain-containing protein n=1 Tax=Herbiconiux sp. SYSU D00978 TaxID=2812562 RepID=UPI001A970260|nr:DUF58 domain-containing protein [Herbiconiux sp. SYSU D00978]